MPNRAAVKPGQREISGVGSAQSGRFRREKEDIKDVELPVDASGGARESARVRVRLGQSEECCPRLYT